MLMKTPSNPLPTNQMQRHAGTPPETDAVTPHVSWKDSFLSIPCTGFIHLLTARNDGRGRFFSFLLQMIVALGCLGLVSGSSARAEPPVWVNVTHDLGGDATNWAMSTLTLGVAPGTDTVYAHIGRVGLFASKDGGAHWTNLVTPPEMSAINGYVSSFLFDPKDPKAFWITCWYGKGLLKTTDAGKTFKQVGTEVQLEGVSVDFTDPERKTMVIGRHEKQGLMISKDGGATWKTIGTNILPDTKFSNMPLLIGPNTILASASGDPKGLTGGIWRSEDAGETWIKVADYSRIRVPMLSSKGIVFWPVRGGLARSSDAGKTWVLLKSPAVDSIIELPDGRLAGRGGHRLALSNDNGDSWTEYGPELPVKPPKEYGQGPVYLPGLKAFLICVRSWGKVNPEAVWRLDAP